MKNNIDIVIKGQKEFHDSLNAVLHPEDHEYEASRDLKDLKVQNPDDADIDPSLDIIGWEKE